MQRIIAETSSGVINLKLQNFRDEPGREFIVIVGLRSLMGSVSPTEVKYLLNVSASCLLSLIVSFKMLRQDFCEVKGLVLLVKTSFIYFQTLDEFRILFWILDE
jgi:hypothetical protein